MTFSLNGHTYSTYEAHLACAFTLYMNTSDETISSIMGARRNGPGAWPISCHELVDELQRSQHVVFTVVANDRATWESRAREEYRKWWDTNTQIVQRCITMRHVVS